MAEDDYSEDLGEIIDSIVVDTRVVNGKITGDNYLHKPQEYLSKKNTAEGIETIMLLKELK